MHTVLCGGFSLGRLNFASLFVCTKRPYHLQRVIADAIRKSMQVLQLKNGTKRGSSSFLFPRIFPVMLFVRKFANSYVLSLVFNAVPSASSCSTLPVEPALPRNSQEVPDVFDPNFWAQPPNAPTVGLKQLSQLKFMHVIKFKGKPFVDIRRFYYNESNEAKPSKKGIALSTDEWRNLVSRFADIDSQITNLENVQLKDDSKTFEITKSKFVKVHFYKESVRIDIRSYFKSATGDLQPGIKGICLTVNEWQTLKEHVNSVDSKLKQQLCGSL